MGRRASLTLYRFNGAVNAPVNPYVDVRAAFHFYHHDGYFQDGFDDADQKGGRLSVKFKPTSDLNVLVSGDYQETSGNGPGGALFASTFTSAGAPPAGPPPLNLHRPSDPFASDRNLYPKGVDGQFERSKLFGGMIEADYDLGWATLTEQAGVRRLDANDHFIDLANPYNPGSVGYAATPSSSTTFSNEIRLTSASRVPLQWVAGLYYFTEKDSGDRCEHATATSSGCLIEIADPFQRTISYAGFGQATYTPPVLDNRLHLTGGIRYNYDQKNATTFETAIFAPPGSNGFLNSFPNLHAGFHAVTYKLEASYDLTPASLLYAQNSTGFRAGGFAYGGTPYYKPETIQAYEIGSKNRLLHDTLQVNLAGYYYIYENRERNVISPRSPFAPSFVPFSDISVQSIGKTRYEGVSAAVEYVMTADDRVDLNVQYLHAYYVSFLTPARYINSIPLSLAGVPTGQTPGDQSGLQVVNTPPWSGTFSYDHSVRAFGGVFDAVAAIQFSDVQHYIEFPTNTLQYKLGTDPAYARLDLSVSYQPERGGWRVTGYINNVTNEYTYTDNFYERTIASGDVDAQLLPPRTFGLILSDKF